MYLIQRMPLNNPEIEEIAKKMKKYMDFFRDVNESHAAKYTIPHILEKVQESLNFLESVAPTLQNWVTECMKEHRSAIWLAAGLDKGKAMSDVWKASQTDCDALQNEWPFLFARSAATEAGFEVDLKAAQQEFQRQKDREDTPNPNMEPFHPDGCPSRGCSCWMMDDMDRWYKEDTDERNASRNIFFNHNLIPTFFEAMVPYLNAYKSQWEHWSPPKAAIVCAGSKEITMGQTPIQIVRKWIASDFMFAEVFSMLSWNESFWKTWNHVGDIELFLITQRYKLCKIPQLF